MRHQRTAATRRGFTLLEIIIASALATTLMLLVWSLFSIYSKLDTKGTRQATEMQLVRSLMRQLRSDVHHMTVATVSNPSQTKDSLPLIPTVALSPPTSLPNGPGLIGSNTRLQFVMRPMRPHDAVSTPESAFASSLKPPLPNVYDVVSYEWRTRDPRAPLDDNPLDVGNRDERAANERQLSGKA